MIEFWGFTLLLLLSTSMFQLLYKEWSVWLSAVFLLIGFSAIYFERYWLLFGIGMIGAFYVKERWSALIAFFLGILCLWQSSVSLIGFSLWITIFHHELILSKFNRKSRLLLILLDSLLVILLFNLKMSWLSILVIGCQGALLVFSQELLVYLYQETDMVYARSLDQIMANYVTEINELYGQVRGWRHDYHNHLQTLMSQLDGQKYLEARHYLYELEGSLKDVEQIIKSGNTTIDAVVNSKLSIAERENIPTNVKVFVGNQPITQEVDLVVILGNLLDNAIEANQEIHVPEKRMLRIYISILKQQLYISVTNARAENQVIMEDFSSTKNDKRGLGIRRINALVAKHEGLINRKYEEGFFVTEVLLPLKNISS